MNQKNEEPVSDNEMKEYLKELEDDPPENYEYSAPETTDSSSTQKSRALAYWITVMHFLVLVGVFCAVAPLYRTLYLFSDDSPTKSPPGITRVLVSTSSFLWNNYLWLVVVAGALVLVGLSYRYRNIFGVKDYIFITVFLWLIFAFLICIILLPLQFSAGL